MKSLQALTVLTTAFLTVLLVGGCTVAPGKFNNGQADLLAQNSTAVVTNDQKAQAVATAGIGVPQVYTDPKLGASVELLVQSEYFSANGRNCRRYTETTAGQSVPGVSCQDKARGWVDIPLSSFVH